MSLELILIIILFVLLALVYFMSVRGIQKYLAKELLPYIQQVRQALAALGNDPGAPPPTPPKWG